MGFGDQVMGSRFRLGVCSWGLGLVDIFLEFSCFFDGPMDVGNLIFGYSAFSQSNLNIWKFLVHVPLKTSLGDFEYDLASM